MLLSWNGYLIMLLGFRALGIQGYLTPETVPKRPPFSSYEVFQAWAARARFRGLQARLQERGLLLEKRDPDDANDAWCPGGGGVTRSGK